MTEGHGEQVSVCERGRGRGRESQQNKRISCLMSETNWSRIREDYEEKNIQKIHRKPSTDAVLMVTACAATEGNSNVLMSRITQIWPSSTSLEKPGS